MIDNTSDLIVRTFRHTFETSDCRRVFEIFVHSKSRRSDPENARVPERTAIVSPSGHVRSANATTIAWTDIRVVGSKIIPSVSAEKRCIHWCGRGNLISGPCRSSGRGVGDSRKSVGREESGLCRIGGGLADVPRVGVADLVSCPA